MREMQEKELMITTPEIGTTATCRMCHEPIVFVGPYWDHQGSIKPRHPAMPDTDPTEAEPDLPVRHRATVLVSKELWRSVFFPSETKILEFFKDRDDPSTLAILVEHPDLPANIPGSAPPIVTPSYRRIREAEGDPELDQIEFIDWGIK
jgi:hypothetical protein